MPETKTVVLTGGAGFIGSHIATALIGHGIPVRVLAGPPGELCPPSLAPEAWECADITDSESLERLFAGAHIVVHAAGPSSVSESFDHAAEYMRVHGVGT